MRCLAREQHLLERLLDGIENLRLRFGQVARKIAQERGLARGVPRRRRTQFPPTRAALETSWPTPCNPRPHPAPAPPHRPGLTRSDAYRPLSRSFRRRNAQPSTVGPSCRASTRSAEATASGSVVSGFCTAVALSPAACNRAITSVQHDPSAKSPCTRTTLRAFGAGCAAGAPGKKVLAAAAVAMPTNVRRFIRCVRCRSFRLFMRILFSVKLELTAGRASSENRSVDVTNL